MKGEPLRLGSKTLLEVGKVMPILNLEQLPRMQNILERHRLGRAGTVKFGKRRGKERLLQSKNFRQRMANHLLENLEFTLL